MPLDSKEIRRRREALGISQTAAARRAGFSIQRWNNIEAGRRLALDPDALLAVAKALECRMEDLIKSRQERHMGPHIRIEGARDGESVKLPQDLDALMIWTAKGCILIDLGEQVENMVLMRAGNDVLPANAVRLIFSPLESGRTAVGVIQTP